MTVDEMITALEGLRQDFGGDAPVFVYDGETPDYGWFKAGHPFGKSEPARSAPMIDGGAIVEPDLWVGIVPDDEEG